MDGTKYGAAELARQAGRLFGTSPEAVVAALRAAGLEEATVSEAKEAVRDFLEREVS